MVVSMTGFGRGYGETKHYNITVEIKSVNHRFCDITTKMPRQFFMFEEKIKKVVQKKVRRGKVDIYVTVGGEGLLARKLMVDWGLMDQLYQAIKDTQDKYRLKGTIEIDQLLKLDDVFSVTENELNDENLEQALLNTVDQALDKLYKMRLTEGESLKSALITHVHNIESNVRTLEQSASVVSDSYRTRLIKRIREFTNHEIDIDEQRLLTEVAIMAEKADINEELTRLDSHLDQFLNILENEDAIGRKLDFLVQEMNREINTIGAKANDVKISQYVVGIKSEVEKIKEQVQNIE